MHPCEEKKDGCREFLNLLRNLQMATFCAMQHYGLNGTLTNLLPTVLVPVRSVQCRGRVYRGLKWLSSGRSGSGKFYQDILQPGRKHNNMPGRSGIGVLVTGFSRVGALKKHAPLVFTSYRSKMRNRCKNDYIEASTVVYKKKKKKKKTKKRCFKKS